jgi:hypothetical protein
LSALAVRTAQASAGAVRIRLSDVAVTWVDVLGRCDRHTVRSAEESDMTSSSTIDISEVAVMAAAGVPVGVTGGGQIGTVLGGLAGVSPALAAAYLGYLVARMLTPAVLIVATIRGVPPEQRGALIQIYLRGAVDHEQHQALEPAPAPAVGAVVTAEPHAGGDHVQGAGDDE